MQASATPLHSTPDLSLHLISPHLIAKEKRNRQLPKLSHRRQLQHLALLKVVRIRLVHMGKERKGEERASVICLEVMKGIFGV